MATYYPSSNSQRDATPMLYTRESFPATYSDAQVLPGNMMIYSNYPSSSGSYSDALAVNSQQQNSCVQIPSIGTSNPQQQDILANFSGSRIGEHGVNAWRDGRNDLLMMHPMGGPTSILHGGQNLQGQALSLSLGTQIPSGIQIPSVHFRDSNSGLSAFLSPNSSISGEGSGRNGDFREDDDISMSKQSNAGGYLPPSLADSIKMDSSPYEMSSIGRTVSNSKYLKAALELLDEVVNVRKALKQPNTVKNRSINELQINASKDADRGLKNDSSTGAPSNPKESTGNSSSQLSPSERQELQNKMTKLLSMLDEVERRYKQYYHQMQIVVSSFDVIAGSGAARPYTSLALQTISRHFRCLRDAISGQIRAIRKSLGELDASSNNKGVGIARLRFVDQQLRQQRAIQQLGMMQHHTWRPQRGLPESSVSVLRAWLFEHFLHPYPKDSDKTILARQTGLTRSQVSNWFINARVRLWKPMVEEMYKEEFGDNGEMDSNSSTDNAPKPTKSDTMASEDRTGNLQQGATSSFAVSSGLRKGSNGETETDYGFVKLSGDQRANAGDCNLFPDTFVQSNENADRFMAAYQMSELGRFGSGGNGVSLTLGLQHRDGNGFPISDETHQNYIAIRGNGTYNEAAGSAELECMETGSRQHRFSSSHLMHDFVA